MTAEDFRVFVVMIAVGALMVWSGVCGGASP